MMAGGMDFLRTDAVVVGGGPAGLAAALALRQQGLDVAVLERQAATIDKACGEGLLPSGVTALARLGVQVSEEALPFRGIRFKGHGRTVEARFPTFGLGVRRTILHRLLRTAAEQAGVRLYWHCRGVTLADGGVISENLSVSANWVIAADGQKSTIRKAAGLDVDSIPSVRYGFRRHFAVRPWTDVVEVHWARDCQAYITPINEFEVGVAVLTRPSRNCGWTKL